MSTKIVICIAVAFPVNKLGKWYAKFVYNRTLHQLVQHYFAPYYDSTPTNFIYTLFKKKNTTPKMLNISKTKYRNHGKLELFYVHNKPDSSDSPPLRWLQRLQIVFTISPRSHDSSPEATHRHRTTRTKLRNIVTTLF